MPSLVEIRRLQRIALAGCADTSRELASHEARLDQLRAARDDAVRAALGVDDLYHRDIAKAAGVSRQYVTLLAKEMRAGETLAPAIDDDDEPWEDLILEGFYGNPDYDYAGTGDFAAIEAGLPEPFTPDEARDILARIDELDLHVAPSQRDHLESRFNGVDLAR